VSGGTKTEKKPATMTDAFATAVNAHKANDLGTAERGYRAVLAAQPNHAEAHYLLGAVLMQTNRLAEAASALTRCLDAAPQHAAAKAMIGPVLSQLGEHGRAIDALKDVTATDPANPTSYYNLGKACIEAGRFEDAVNAIKKFLDFAPDHADALTGYTKCLVHIGENDKARGVLESIIERGLDSEDTHVSYTKLLIDMNDGELAANAARRASEKYPDAPAVRLAEAGTLQHIGKTEDARALLETLAQAHPDRFDVNNTLATLLYEVGQWKIAEGYARKAVELEPASVGALNNLGRIREIRGDIDGARLIYKKALKIAPDNGDTYNNLGNINLYANDIDAAVDAFNHAVELKPHKNGIRFNRSLALLTKGQFANAWREYRLRFEKSNSVPAREWDCARWDGEPVNGKRVLVWSDQGIGDQIIHARCLSGLLTEGASVAYECSKRMVPLFARSFPDVDVYPMRTPPDEELSSRKFDYHSAILDIHLGRITSSEDVRSAPYLKADPDMTAAVRAKYRSAHGERPLIGISWWSGGTTQAHYKSTPLADWVPILKDRDATFINLQYGDKQAELDAMANDHGIEVVHDPDIDPLTALDPFAAQVAAMDLVITISNTTAHMAGALGVPVWNMVPTGPGRLWYWLIDGAKSPWYESMTLFRHAYTEDWSGVIDAVARRLDETLADLALTAGATPRQTAV
jgi:tetratricopeptide (TPR) repeat protein